MAENEKLVRVFREDGSGMKLKAGEVDAFIAANPGAKVEGQREVAKSSADAFKTEAEGGEPTPLRTSEPKPPAKR